MIPNIHLTEGYYLITEIQAPNLDKTPHEVYLRPGKTTEVSIKSEKKPGLTIIKIGSVVGDDVKGAKFELWVSKDKTTAPIRNSTIARKLPKETMPKVV